MKRFTLLSVVVSIGWIGLNAQISHEISLSCDYAYVVQIDEGSTKYCAFDEDVNEIKIFNTDGTLYRTLINYPDTIAFICYITEKLFNTDSKIEYMAYDWDNGVKIYDEDGGIIFQEDSLTALEDVDDMWFETNTIVNTESGTKMFLFDYYNNNLEIFSLPGRLPYCAVGTSSDLKVYKLNSNTLKSYPNPTNGEITIDYKINCKFEKGIIELINSNGQIIRTYDFYENIGKISIGENINTTGLYIYNIFIDNRKIKTDKILVVE